MTLAGAGPLRSLVPTRDDDHVLLVASNYNVVLLNFATGKTTASVKLPVSAFTGAVTRDKSVIAVCGAWGLIHLWDVANNRLLRQSKRANARCDA